MCGIAGIWGDASQRRLHAMADALRHRGPDDEGYWRRPDNDFGFAHRRLAVIDIDGGRQPIANETGDVVVACNGEIYNYEALRADLVARGHVFQTATDTETIVHQYEEDGPAFVNRLRGMFAIGVWDERRRQLILARDRVGKKPLYYAQVGGEFLFASEIKGVLAGLAHSPTIELQSVVDYLTWSAIHSPATIYREIRSLNPGELLVVHDREIVQRTRYWRINLLPKERLTRADALEQVEQRLRDAVRVRMRADVRVGAFLSGGIDSGLVTAMAANLQTAPLITMTVGMDDGAFDERPLAKLVAQRYGTEHHEIAIKPDVAHDLETIAGAYDQPFGDASAIPSYYVSQAAREHVKVVLNGDGGDEIFAGYRRYVAGWIAGWLSRSDYRTRNAGDSIGRRGWRTVARVMPTPGRFRSGYAFVHRLVRGLGLDPVRRYMAWSVDVFDGAALADLMPAIAGLDSGDRLAADVLDRFVQSGPVDRMLGADFETILPHDLLVKMDIATMAHGLEARCPLLDHQLIETVARFPERLKLGGTTTKPLLRELAGRYLPREICMAPKRGFEVPVERWLREDLREMSQEVILERNGLLSELFDRKALSRLLCGDHGLDPGRWTRRVWHLLMLGVWDQCVHRQDVGASASRAGVSP